MKLNIFVVLMLTIVGLMACESAPKVQKPTSEKISYSEFNKVLRPASQLVPLPGGQASLLLISLPDDKYAKVYKLNHQDQGFELVYDAGRNISGLTSDRTQKTYYLLLDSHGDENYQIYKLNPEAKKVTKVFGHEERKAMVLDTSFDGQSLYVSSNHKQKDQFRIYKVDSTTGESTDLTDGKISFYNVTADPAGRHLALMRLLGNNQREVYLYNLKTKQIRKALGKESVIYDPAFFGPKSQYLYINSNDGRNRNGCARVSLKSPQKLEWVKVDEQKDIECAYDHPSNLSFVKSVYDGRVDLQIFKGVLDEPLQFKLPEKSIISSLQVVPDSTDVVARIVRSDSPGDYYLFNPLKEQKSSLERISNLNRSPLKETDFGKSYDLRFKSFDGMEIHGIVFAKEDWVKKGVKHPVILWPHGGPDSHVTHSYNPLFQYWVQRGFVVFAPNFRGSTGYGTKFETLNDKDWGGGHIKDLIAGKNALSKLDYVDDANIFIVGASFGGFSTLSAITQYPKEFKAAVAMVALANLFTFMESIPKDPAWQGEFLAEVGHPQKDKALYKERSPYFHAKNIQIPLKIYQAENDVRTVKAEMDNFVKQLKENEVAVDYEVLEKEGHQPTRAETWEQLLEGTADFLQKQI